MAKSFIHSLLAVSLVLAPVQAQDNTSWDELQKVLKHGERIRVLDVKRATIDGNLTDISVDRLTIQHKRLFGPMTSATIARSDVVHVSRTGRRNVLLGALIGGGAGTAAGVGIAVGGKNNPDYSTGQVAAIFGILLGAAGAGIGAAVGHARPDVHVLYRAPVAARTN